ncbi:uncharacterized protein DCS_01262 [Drechmeria coniospora]|uniref:Protein BNI4 n=1 Tax=Drechmeria coniospora TaxID=98403 RepID=A0A151GSQ2_DRECN|nr:uncharacterized protein DCS_01262 [Drechmeria coniospora]KYK60127.1 uncharacterized protein DCS_01262 [Drechmeria coniospora]
MLQTRPPSTSGIISASQPHGNHQYMGSTSQAPRSVYQGAGAPTYHGNGTPVQPYAFASTPNLHQSTAWNQYGTFRTHSSPAIVGPHTFDPSMNFRIPVLNGPSAATMGASPSFGVSHGGSRDDSAISTARTIVPAVRPQSFIAVNNQPSFGSAAAVRNAPDRYRRSSSGGVTHHGRSKSSTLPPSITMLNPGQQHGGPTAPTFAAQSHAGSQGLATTSSMDDLRLYNNKTRQEEGKRLRHRSRHTVDSPELQKVAGAPAMGDATRTGPTSNRSSEKGAKSARMASSQAHSRSGSSSSVSSTRSSHSRSSSTAANRNVSTPTANPSLPASDEPSTNTEQPKMVTIPPRGSSDAAKRTLNPSPLSRPVTMDEDLSSQTAPAGPASANVESPAAQHLAAINRKRSKPKSKTSRLRRAFSFGSAADFRKAAGGQGHDLDRAEPSKLHKEPSPDEAYDVEQARIAEAQEAAGIGNSIYGGRFFGSTDNLSISSTASSASIMIRKMGHGMKKSTRSLAGLFRPKSVIGVPAADSATPEGSEATVSMITAEAEAQRVNVTADPAAANGGTGFPHLERNSLDAAHVPEMSDRLGSSGTDNSASRKSIIGGDKERAEVLAAVRKGILKRSSSPSLQGSPELVLPSMPAISDSPSSSAPSTPNDESHGHRRTGSIAIGNEDYFMSALRLRQDTKSPPGTSQGSKRNAKFSPRIIFYDTWPSQEYDRRGEVATCNRLTPMLAQQIKEELNTFKMEMEVHENSKIYTHFF